MNAVINSKKYKAVLNSDIHTRIKQLFQTLDKFDEMIVDFNELIIKLEVHHPP